LGWLACPQLVGGDPLGPPGTGRAFPAPGVQPAADPVDGVEVAGDEDASALGERQQRERGRP
jgi:hypothetical protein